MSAPERIVIVGAGPAGLAVARAYRAHGGAGQVMLLGAEAHPPYERPPLTKELLRGELRADELPIESPDWFAENAVELRLDCAASAIDPASGTVAVPGQTLRADAIVLATGSEPLRPELPGLQDPSVLTIRERTDSERIAALATPGTRVLVLGTGFIGCELAASLAMSGALVTLIGQEQAPQRQRLGDAAAARIAGWLQAIGVTLELDAQASAVVGGRAVHLEGGKQIEGDLVLLGMGVQPRGELAEAAGLRVVDGAILTDSHMRAHERVLAVGDVAYAHNAAAGRRLRVEHWGDALGQGEIAGRVLAGEDASWRDVPGFWSTIGRHTLKHAAWGDGHDACELVEHPGGAFTVWYSREGELVGVLTHERDEDYERGRQLIAAGWPAA
jgi:3-phenylpropionate/trans-cinnamate dioxygenase ferredoxin reductase component